MNAQPAALENRKKTEAVNRFISGVSGHDINVIKEIFDKNAVVEDPAGSPPLVGIEAVCGLFERAFDMGVRLAATGPVRCAGHEAAVPFLVTFEQMKIESIDVFAFGENGKIVSMKAYWGPENVLPAP